jgi:hypothetical protein
MRALRLVLMAAVVAITTTCGSTVEPVSGWVDIRLTTPNSGDGGIIFTVGGASVDSVRSSFPKLYTRQLSETSWQVLVAGNLNSAVIAQIHVPDVNKLGGYAATPTEVAGQDFAQRATAGYSLAIEGPQGQ